MLGPLGPLLGLWRGAKSENGVFLNNFPGFSWAPKSTFKVFLGYMDLVLPTERVSGGSTYQFWIYSDFKSTLLKNGFLQ